MQLANQGDVKGRVDWRIVAGMIVSIVWIVILVFYLFQQVSWRQFLQLPLDQFGSFLGGAFSPLAFLWLVIGFFIQQGEIQDNARNIEIQAQHTNLDNFLKMAGIVYQHLGVIEGFLAVSCREDLESVSTDAWQLEERWSKASAGDVGIFARVILSYQYNPEGGERDMETIFFSTPIRLGHSAKYRKVFEGLLEDSLLCDASGGLRESLIDGTVWGILYKVLVKAEGKAALSSSSS